MRLISALNKYWRPLTNDEFLWDMDFEMTNEAIQVAQFPEEVVARIWEREKIPFEITWR